MEYLGQIRTDNNLLKLTYSIFRDEDTGRLTTVYQGDIGTQARLIKECKLNKHNKGIIISGVYCPVPRDCYDELVRVFKDIELNKNEIMKEVVKSKLLGTDLDFSFVLNKIGYNGYAITHHEETGNKYYVVIKINDYDCVLLIDIKDTIKILGVQCLTRKYTQEAVKSTIKYKDRDDYLINDLSYMQLCYNLRCKFFPKNIVKVYLVNDDYVLVKDNIDDFHKFLVRDRKL